MLRRSLLLLALLAASAFETTDAKKAKAAKPVTKDSAGFSDEELEEAMEEVLHSPSPPTVNLTDTRRLGTYDVSIIPDEDCCTLFTPKHPATRATAAQVDEAEAALSVDGLVDAAAANAERRDLRFPPAAAPTAAGRA